MREGSWAEEGFREWIDFFHPRIRLREYNSVPCSQSSPSSRKSCLYFPFISKESRLTRQLLSQGLKNGKCVIRNLVSLVRDYLQYGSVAELIYIFFIISKTGRKRWVSLSKSTHCNSCIIKVVITRLPASLSASYLPKLYVGRNAEIEVKSEKFRW